MPKSIKLSTSYNHSIHKVWAAITDADAMSIWLMPCDFKPEVGYEFQFKTKPAPGFDGIVNCKVIKLEPPYQLVFSWSGGSLKDTTVHFTLSEAGEDCTKLDFEHSGFEGFMNNVLVKRILAAGWKRKILTRLLPDYLQNHE